MITQNLPQHTGGLTLVPDSDDLYGWITNAQASEQLPGRELYQERFVVLMPEISDEDRNAATNELKQTVGVDIPEDPLTLRY